MLLLLADVHWIAANCVLCSAQDPALATPPCKTDVIPLHLTRMGTFGVALCAYALGNSYLAALAWCILWCVRDPADDGAALAYAV